MSRDKGELFRPGAIGAAAVALALLAAPAHGRTLGEVAFEPCVLTAAGLPRPTEAQCATIAVPENPAAPEGRSIELALAWIPVEGEAEPDPVFMIAGGPGQSARDSYPMVASAFGDVRRSRHIMLLDQRGTGESNPLVCDMPDDEDEMPGFDEFSPERARELAETCRDELAEQADLRFYSTAEAVFDQPRGATRALQSVTAGAAQCQRRVSPPVEKQHRLFIVGKGLAERAF